MVGPPGPDLYLFCGHCGWAVSGAVITWVYMLRVAGRLDAALRGSLIAGQASPPMVAVGNVRVPTKDDIDSTGLRKSVQFT